MKEHKIKFDYHIITEWRFGLVFAKLRGVDTVEFIPAETVILDLPFEIYLSDDSETFNAFINFKLSLVIHGGTYHVGIHPDGFTYKTISGRKMTAGGIKRLDKVYSFFGENSTDFIARSMINAVIDNYKSDFERAANDLKSYLELPEKSRKLICVL